MICVYDGQDAMRAGHGLGVVHPSDCVITEETGGSYELSMTLPLSREWQLMQKGHVIRAKGAPHRISKQVQDFRIYSRELADDGRSLKVAARHEFYDGSTAFVLRRVDAKAQTVNAVLDAMRSASDEVPFSLDAQAGAAVYTGSMELVNWVNALLAPGTGLVAGARLRMERDGLVVRLRPEGGSESGLRVKWGHNMTGLNGSEAIDQVVTRLQPVGEAADGSHVYLPEKYVDSPRIGAYWKPLVSAWKVAGAKVGQKVRRADGSTVELTQEDVFTLLREAAAERLNAGCDVPAKQTSFAYVDLRQTDAASAAWTAEHVCLYDWCTVIHSGAALDEKVQVTGYTWDVLIQRYTQLEVGDAFRDRTDTALVTTPQLRKEASAALGRSLRVADLVDIAAEEIRMQARRIELIAYDFEDLDRRTSQAEILLDGMDGQITQLGTKVTDQGNTISQVESDLNAAIAAINLRATLTQLEEASSRISDVSARIDALSGELELKVSEEEYSDLVGRVSAAESSLLITAEGLATKVDKDGVISSINQSPEAVKIAAKLIELQGDTVVQALSGLRVDVSYLDSYGADLQELYLQGQFVDMAVLTMGDVVSGTVWGLGGEISLQHSHKLIDNGDGTFTLGEVASSGSSFNIAETLTYKNGVSAAYGNGYNVGFAAAKEAYQPTAVNRTGYDTAGKTVTVRVLNGHQDLLTGQVINAAELYNAGWNECRAAAISWKVLVNYYSVGETLYDKDGNVATGPWYKGTEAYRYELPAAK